MSTSTLGDVGVLARLLVDAETAVDKAELALSRAKENARRIREESLPSAMDELGLTSLKLEDGSTITVSPEVYCSITEEKRFDAHAWLEANDFGGLIKTEVLLPFGRDEEERKSLAEMITWLNENEITFSKKESVHAGTLKAWLKEQLRDGDPKKVPLQLFGARPVTVAKVKLPKGN